jgi:hypothetical protein
MRGRRERTDGKAAFLPGRAQSLAHEACQIIHDDRL